MKTRTKIKAGDLPPGPSRHNHNASGIRVKSTAKAGSLTYNHNSGIRVKTTAKAGSISLNHNAGV